MKIRSYVGRGVEEDFVEKSPHYPSHVLGTRAVG